MDPQGVSEVSITADFGSGETILELSESQVKIRADLTELTTADLVGSYQIQI